MYAILLYRPIVRRFCAALAFSIVCQVVFAQDKPSISGVVETYWLANPATKGAYDQLNWAEFRGRLTKNWSATWSGFDAGSISGYDESYARYETDTASVRAGRMRTSFGFSDWSELFYTGISHKPLVREMSIVGKTKLDRDDSGAEVTTNIGALQLQAAAIETSLTRAQVGPSAIDSGTITAQYGLGSLILGSEVLGRTDFSQKVYGENFRYTFPHWTLKGEYFEGVGPKAESGGYVDAIYRIPYKLRTELVAREEQVRYFGSDAPTQLTTVGIRHTFGRYVTANLNYAWGNELDYSSYASSLAVAGWSVRVMFQVQL